MEHLMSPNCLFCCCCLAFGFLNKTNLVVFGMGRLLTPALPTSLWFFARSLCWAWALFFLSLISNKSGPTADFSQTLQFSLQNSCFFIGQPLNTCTSQNLRVETGLLSMFLLHKGQAQGRHLISTKGPCCPEAHSLLDVPLLTCVFKLLFSA